MNGDPSWLNRVLQADHDPNSWGGCGATAILNGLGGIREIIKFDPYILSKLIEEGEFKFAKDIGGHLYSWRNGCYQSDGRKVVARCCKALLERFHKTEKWRRSLTEEVTECLSVDAPLLWDKPPDNRICVLNGLLDLETGTLTEHSAEFLSPVQLPVRFDPNARCPNWETFIRGVFPEDTYELAWQIPAWLMVPWTAIQKAVVFTGEGANGKSTFLRAIVTFLGESNVSTIDLQRLEADRFAVARLVGKLANICPDLPATNLTGTSVFKSITGGDRILGERKFEQSFEFTPYARLLFSANIPPRSLDASSAFFRRWIVIPFERSFADGDPGTFRPDVLDARLADPGELSGVLNKAVGVLPQIKASGLTESVSTSRALAEFREHTDPVAVWLNRYTVLDPGGVIRKDRLYQAFSDYCATSGITACPREAFGRSVLRLRPGIASKQRTLNGARNTWVYVGLRLM